MQGHLSTARDSHVDTFEVHIDQTKTRRNVCMSAGLRRMEGGGARPCAPPGAVEYVVAFARRSKL